jgi:hypothetical protein
MTSCRFLAVPPRHEVKSIPPRYLHRAWQFFLLGGLLQLTSPEALKDMQDGLRAREGCQLECKLPIPRVAGSFHISMHSQSYELARQARASSIALF